MPMTDDELQRLSEELGRRLRMHADCPLADPEQREKHDKHHAYIDTVLEREAERAAIRRAVIEKSLGGLVWSGLVGVAIAVWAYIKEHLK
jgi:hypothetical protein